MHWVHLGRGRQGLIVLPASISANSPCVHHLVGLGSCHMYIGIGQLQSSFGMGPELQILLQSHCCPVTARRNHGLRACRLLCLMPEAQPLLGHPNADHSKGLS